MIMKNVLPQRFLLVLVLFASITLHVFGQKTENVIIVVIDGARYTETFGDALHQYIPKIWNDLRPKGTIYTSFYNNGVTSTNPGHSTILTGTWQNIPNDGSVRPTSPTIFEYYRKQLNTSLKESYVILGKDKLNILSYSSNAQYGSSYGASVKTSTSMYDDAVTLQNIKTVMSTDKPHIMIANFAATDNGGHSGVYINYTNSLKTADGLVSDLWNYIQADPVYKDKTTLIITNDHGRHTTDFANHGCTCEGCKHIMMLIIGPDTPAGVVDNASHQQIDIAPTVGSFMHFTTPLCVGVAIPSAILTYIKNFSKQTISVSENYPNPFTSSTTIKYILEQEGNVQASILDTQGKQVRTFMLNNQSIGEHQIIWNGTDDANNPVANGVYFYSISLNGILLTSKRMVKF